MMRQQPGAIGAGYEPHAAVLHRHRLQRNPEMDRPQRNRPHRVRLILMPGGGCLVMRWFENTVIELVTDRYAEQLARDFPAAPVGQRLTQPRLEDDRLVDF